MIVWRHAPTRRAAWYADHAGARLFVQETVRSDRAHAMLGGREYAAHVSGLRVGEFAGVDLAKDAAARQASCASRDAQERRVSANEGNRQGRA